MYGMDPLDRDDRWRVRLHMVLRVVAVAVAVAGVGFGIRGFQTKAIGAHVTACQFDAHGVYAKVRVNNLLRSSGHRKVVYVDFYAKSSHGVPVSPYGSGGSADVTVPAHGHGTVIVRGAFPDQSDKVKGRTIYALAHDGLVTVSKEFAMEHPTKVRTVTVPDDSSWLRCSIGEVTEYRD